jgi:hypothetical protein
MGVRALSKAIEYMHGIESLKLHFDNIGCTKVACRYIGRVLVKLNFLKTFFINFRSNDINHEGADPFYAGFIESP